MPNNYTEKQLRTLVARRKDIRPLHGPLWHRSIESFIAGVVAAVFYGKLNCVPHDKIMFVCSLIFATWFFAYYLLFKMNRGIYFSKTEKDTSLNDILDLIEELDAKNIPFHELSEEQEEKDIKGGE